ncbi:hypothetical protein [Planobispora longispora]|uniref:Uncharacterized protein n=1 Tax=Planobispora longispora TaxID=28887 RepID=A0A8J3W2N5_9ACTN|nr:hypothetical protein [Planobispora longispora]GIH73952.1 hypothetical protein Plo01_03810 [Planobispora longispora]
MNDRPDRLVHGRPTRADEDTQPQVPPQRDDAVPPDQRVHPVRSAHPGQPAAPDQVSPDQAPTGRPGDRPERETPLTDADRAESTERDPSADALRPGDRTGPKHAGPNDRQPAETAGPVHPAPVQAPQSPGRTTLFGQDPEDVRRRWQEVQAGFVDDPRQAVERASSLLGEVTDAIRAALEARATDLQGRWKDGGQEGAEGSDTERLRTVLREYRSTLEELLGLPVTSAGKR